MIEIMNTGGENAGAEHDSSARVGRRRVLISGGILAAAAIGAVVWVWAPWVDRSPFTGYSVGTADGENTIPGSTADTCVRKSASEEETVIYDEDGHKLAAGRAPREGERLGPEFGDFAGDCLFVTRIDNIPGGKGSYFSAWGGGSKSEVAEEWLRESPEDQREGLKTAKKLDSEDAEELD
ncbi:hypothetical protein [Streptomyces sp. NPDC005898]|uniref:hypothetical protein n=1 Tax=Streptomyces sp. NPDC005898 TaxID=3157082 RepID=UPI0033EC62B5